MGKVAMTSMHKKRTKSTKNVGEDLSYIQQGRKDNLFNKWCEN